MILVVAMVYIQRIFKAKGFKTFGIDIVPSLKEIWEQNIKKKRGGGIL